MNNISLIATPNFTKENFSVSEHKISHFNALPSEIIQKIFSFVVREYRSETLKERIELLTVSKCFQNNIIELTRSEVKHELEGVFWRQYASTLQLSLSNGTTESPLDRVDRSKSIPELHRIMTNPEILLLDELDNLVVNFELEKFPLYKAVYLYFVEAEKYEKALALFPSFGLTNDDVRKKYLENGQAKELDCFIYEYTVLVYCTLENKLRRLTYNLLDKSKENLAGYAVLYQG